MSIAIIAIFGCAGFITFTAWALCKVASDIDDEMNRDDLD